MNPLVDEDERGNGRHDRHQGDRGRSGISLSDMSK
jgi:hypothetical protein